MLSWAAAKEWALSLPEAEECDHFGSPSFRIRGKIFVQLSAPDKAEKCAALKLPAADQAALILLDPDTFSAIPRWGKYGWTRVQLDSVDAAVFNDILVKSWREVAPKKLVAAFDKTNR